MSKELKEIQRCLTAKAIPEAKAAHQKFVPGKEKIYGVRTPVLNELAQQYKAGGFELAEELWKAGALEEKLLAVKILGKIAKKDPERSLKLIQHFAKNIGNWAVCDAMGMQGLKPILKTHQEQIFALAWQYNSSKDFWQRRLSLVLVEDFCKDPSFHADIKKLIVLQKSSKEYYIKKAVEWLERNLEKSKSSN